MQGDLEAFYLRHFKAIYRVCYAFMKNAQDAEAARALVADDHGDESLQGQAQALVAAEGDRP